MKIKKTYESPKIEIQQFEVDDIIATSNILTSAQFGFEHQSDLSDLSD